MPATLRTITAPASALPAYEFAAQYGFGISTIRETDFAPAHDPNQEIREALSPQDLEAYQIALRGAEMADGKWSPSDGPFPTALEQGCSGKAELEVGLIGEDGRRSGLWSPEQFEGLSSQFHQLSARFTSHPDVREAENARRACMKVQLRDVSIAGAADPSRAISERLGELEHGKILDDDSVEMLDVDPEDLAELQQLEIELAVADLACRSEHYADVLDIQHAFESEFIDEHREELEEFREYLIFSFGAEAFAAD